MNISQRKNLNNLWQPSKMDFPFTNVSPDRTIDTCVKKLFKTNGMVPDPNN